VQDTESVKCQSTGLGLVRNHTCFLKQSQKHFQYEKIVVRSSNHKKIAHVILRKKKRAMRFFFLAIEKSMYPPHLYALPQGLTLNENLIEQLLK
jgi:hypothetical protein